MGVPANESSARLIRMPSKTYQDFGTKPPGHWFELGLLVLLAAIWSSSFMLIKVAVAEIPPFSLATGRMALASVLLLAWALRGEERIPMKARYLGIYLFMGFFGNALPFTLIGWGELTVDSGLAAILMGIMPITTAILAHFFVGNEPLVPTRAVGAAVGLTGLVVLVGWDILDQLGNELLAQLAVLGGAVSYAVNTVFARRHVGIPGKVLAAGSMTAGTLLLIPITLLVESTPIQVPSFTPLMAMILLGILPTGLAALLYFRLVKSLGASGFSQVNYLIPLMGVAWGVLLLGEEPGLREATALVLILTGVALVNRRRNSLPKK
jgi:drug/metabolite transporter (DMT)-like permease